MGPKALIVAIGLAASLAATAGLAHERDTPDEAKAKALAEQAARHIAEVGPQ
jgi:hypothetical protein